MNLTTRFFHPTHSSYAYQPLNQQDYVTDEAVDITNEENPYNEPAPLAACRTGNLPWLNEELSRDASVVYRDYRSGRNGQMIPLLYIAAQEGHFELAMRLIEAGADVNQAIEGGTTPLLIAATHDDTELARLLIKNGADVNLSRKKDGTTPLIFAAAKDYTELARLLIDKGADVNLSRKDGATPLMFAADKGHTALARRLVEQGADVNYSMMSGATPLYFAVRSGHRDIVRLLLEADANPAKKCLISTFPAKSVSPKYVARHITKDESVVGMIKAALKHRSIDTFRHNPYKETAPMAACRTGNLAWLNEEIAQDKSVALRHYKSEKSKRYVPLLTTATKQGHTQVVQRLIESGADVNASRPASSSDKPCTPLALAVWYDHPDIVSLLLEHGAKTDEPNSLGRTPLGFAAAIGNHDVVGQLIRHGADINHANKKGLTPLFDAASYGHLAVVERLIEHGADVNHTSKKGLTPLFMAASWGHLDVVKFLIDHGAQVNKPTNDNATPFYIAAQNGHKETIKYLLKAGADPGIQWRPNGSFLPKSPREAAFYNAHDIEIIKIINTALKQRAVNRTPSEECLLSTNSNPGK